MPAEFAASKGPWDRNNEYAKPKQGELIRKLNARFEGAYYWRSPNDLASSLTNGPLADIEACLQKMQAQIVELSAAININNNNINDL